MIGGEGDRGEESTAGEEEEEKKGKIETGKAMEGLKESLLMMQE